MMPDDQNTNRVTDDAKKKVVGKARQVCPADVALTDREGFGSLGGLFDSAPQFAIEFVREFRSRDLLVILHDLRDVGVNPRMKNQPHHSRRRAMR